ncbi:pilus assembly protein TadG-related protein [Burkholderia cenocepacia]|uniref:pilus assembly protein TadG-related protein n=1 Tax=Burkholderia cenocepacia TaxID=95486 RepID=UPI00264DAEB5|nr:pilus assembly protein TadG-related protein [Burkholderia cenocepacia]MDN7678989.1 pilus assembly protein TadG-related protein [Burkholderia cenocepacia]
MRTIQSPTVRRRRACCSHGRRQRGGAGIMATIFLAIAVIALGATDIGRYYAERRHMQSAADLAALSAATQAANDATCTAATTAVNQVTNVPVSLLSGTSTATVTCGIWSPPPTSGASAQFTRTSGAALPANNQCAGLSAGVVSAGQSVNAVCVTVSERVSGIFINGVTISASAIAKSVPTDTFTLTTSLATLNGGLANKLLQVLTGSPNALSLQVLDYQGLAQVNLKLAGILANLPVGTTTGVLNGTVTLGQLANATLQAATQQNLVGANLNVLNAIVAALCSGSVCGGPQIALGQLVSAATATGTSAVNASVNALGLLSTALQIANGTSSVNIPSVTVQTPTVLSPLLNVNVSGSVKLGANPPSTASGPPGPTTCGTSNCTTNTSTAQGNVFLNTSISLLSTCPSGGLVYPGGTCSSGSPTPLAAVQLPITAYVAPATAGLASVTCSANGTKSATVNVQTGLLAVYIGGAANTPINLNASSGYSPDGSASPIQLVSVNLSSLLNLLSLGGLSSTLASLLNVLTLGIVNLNAITINISLLPGQMTVVPVANQSPTPLVFTYPGPGSSASPSPASPYMLGTGTDQFLAPAVTGVANNGLKVSLSLGQTGLLGALAAAGIDLSGVLSQLLNTVLGPLLNALASTLVPLLLQPIDSLLTSVTGLLGLSLGNAYVTNTPDSIKCGDPMLVQ